AEDPLRTQAMSTNPLSSGGIQITNASVRPPPYGLPFGFVPPIQGTAPVTYASTMTPAFNHASSSNLGVFGT
ncbi:hypothetical protein SESBI_50413, partial [Sesbania bispinosa]